MAAPAETKSVDKRTAAASGKGATSYQQAYFDAAARSDVRYAEAPHPSPPIVTIDKRAAFRPEMNILAENAIIAAHECDGYPFGGYVRDHKILGIDGWKDLDLHFKKQSDANDFIALMNNGMVDAVNITLFERGNDTRIPVTHFHEQKEDVTYPFKRMLTRVASKLTDIGILVDIVVAATLPVNDFDINHITWDCKTDKFNCHGLGHTDLQVARVKAKTTTMLAGYLALQTRYLEAKKNDVKLDKHLAAFEFRVNKLLANGFRITNHIPYAPPVIAPMDIGDAYDVIHREINHTTGELRRALKAILLACPGHTYDVV